MTYAFKRKILETSVLVAAMLVVTCFIIDLSPMVSAQTASVTLIISPIGSGTIDISEIDEFDLNITTQTILNLTSGSYELTANANSGFVFSSWATTGGISGYNSKSASISPNITASGTITAIFTPQYNVSFATSGGGTSTTSPSGTLTYNASQQVPISAHPASGYNFTSWRASSPGIMFEDSSSASTTAMINAAGTITATFTQLAQVTFAINGGGGTISPSGTQTYNMGQQITVTATPVSGYSFLWWNSSGSITFTNPNATSTNATVNSAGTIFANFAQATYQVSFVLSGGGSSVISPFGTQTYTAGQQVTINASAASAYVFSDWSANPPSAITFANASSNSTTATIAGSATITAKFNEQTIPPSSPTISTGPSQSPSNNPQSSATSSNPPSSSPGSTKTPPTETSPITPSPTTELSPTPTQSHFGSTIDAIPLTLGIIVAVSIAALGAGLILSYVLRPSLKKFGKDLQNRRTKEAKHEKEEEKDKEKDRIKKKPFLKLEIKVPSVLWGSKSGLAEGKVLNQGIATAHDVQVCAVCTPGLALNKSTEKISTLKPFEEKPISFPFVANNQIKRGNYKLRFEVKSSQTSSRVKDRSLRAMRIGLLTDAEGKKNSFTLRKWLSDRSLLWDELVGADSFIKLLEFDLLVVAYQSEMPLKWVKNISNFVEQSQSLFVIGGINTSNMELISQTLGYSNMLFEDFESSQRLLVVLDNHHEATKTLSVGSEVPLSQSSKICTSKIDKGAVLAKQTVRNINGESQDLPAIVANNYGEGRAIFLNFCLEQSVQQENEIFENIFNWLLFKNTTCALGKEELS